MGRGRRIVFASAALLLALAVGAIAGELALRAAGYAPWRTNEGYLLAVGEPVVHAPDQQLGWRLVPGRYSMPPYDRDPRSQEVVTTIWPGGLRATARVRRQDRRRIVFVGGSYTYGWAISDHETFPFMLQSRLPSVEIVNLATTAYGTYQSLLRLERFLVESEHAPSLVVYGMLEDHERRNVGTAPWLRMLSSWSRRGHVDLPYAVLSPGDGVGLERRAPEAYPVWPGSTRSALIALFQDQYSLLRARGRERQKWPVTRALIDEMAALAHGQGARLLVVLLSAGNEKRELYAHFLREREIEYVDCVDPLLGTPGRMVNREGHPNGAMNTSWAKCLEGRLQVLLREL